jgi:hypothetical protein
MIGFYLTVSIVLVLIAYAGVDETRRLFFYIDLQLRYSIIRVRMELMRRKLKKQLMIDRENFMKRE